MEEIKYQVYVKVDSNNVITQIESSISSNYIDFTNGWIQIDEGSDGEKYARAQVNYLDKGLIDINFKYNYKLVDGKVIERIEEEKIDLDLFKQIKIKELSDKCNEVIMSGFYSDADGVNKLYDFALENQLNMMGLKPKAEKGEIVSYYAKGENCHDYTSTQFLKLTQDGQDWKYRNIQKYKDKLKLMVFDCKTINEVESINWDTIK